MNANHRGAPRWVQLVCGLEAVLLVALITLVVVIEIVLDMASGSSAVLVGIVVTLKRRQNLVGWALLLVGAGFLVNDLLSVYAQLALLDPQYRGLPAGAAAEAAAGGSWTLLMAGVFMLLVVFPGGAVRSRAAGRWLRGVLAGFAIVWFIISTDPGRFDSPFHRFKNPLAFVNDRYYFVPAIPIIVGCLLSVLWAAVLAVRRFRRATGQERQQFKWLAASALLLLITFPVAAAFNSSAYGGIAFSVALVALPVSVGIAVLRYRLYEIDKLISRTISYAILTGLLVAVFVGIVALATDVLPFSSPVAVAASTLAAAALFNPLRRRIQHAVDRRFNRARYDAEAIVAAFTLRLRDAVDLDTVRSELLAAVDGAVKPTYVSVWIRPPAAHSSG